MSTRVFTKSHHPARNHPVSAKIRPAFVDVTSVMSPHTEQILSQNWMVSSWKRDSAKTLKSIKQITIGLAVAALSIIPLSSPVLAATDEEAARAAQAGVAYLAENQNTDGSVAGFGGETEWAVVAVAATSQDPETFKKDSGASAVEFLENDPPTETTPATTTERKVVAIAAAGEDITNFGDVDYKAQLESHHTDDQIGDPTLLNDDIFGVIAIDAAQTPELHEMAQDGLDYMLAHQQTDGGFSYTTLTCDFYCGSDSNDTAAAIIAMDAAEHMGLTHALLVAGKEKAVVYLLSTQQTDGGFGYDAFSVSDGSSTAWALMALNVIGDSVRTQALAARDWLLANQNSDGGFSYGAFGLTESSTSITAHTVVALLGSSWLLRPEPIQLARGGSSTSTTPTGATSSTPASQPNVVLASATTSSSSLAESAQSNTGSSGPNPVDSDTKAAKTADKSENQGDKSDKSNANYAWVGIPVLLAIGGAWYVLQSRNKQEA